MKDKSTLGRMKVILFACLLGFVCSLKLRVVTWNVAENKKMKGHFTDSAIDKVLSLSTTKKLADVYAIGVQENCWKCNVGNFPTLGQRFVDRINQYKKSSAYELVAVKGTRESSVCELGCSLHHGSSVLIVVAKKKLVSSHTSFRWTDYCSSKFLGNKEKGVAAVSLKLAEGKSVCFGNLHLDSKKSTYRRSCLQKFLQQQQWNCQYRYLFGDFNARTGPKAKGGSDTGVYMAPDSSKIPGLKKVDEFAGSTPYGTSTDWGKNMLEYINKYQQGVFKEGMLIFPPTYSIRPSEDCNGKKTCYRSNRPVSWTDRIIYSEGKVLSYGAVVEVYADHFPVYADFEIN